jgi:hypothetical protein
MDINLMKNIEIEEKIIDLTKKKGPMTGSELMKDTGSDGLVLWRTCKLSPRLIIRNVGTRYLRLDRRLKKRVRLSPSIFREFLSYSVVSHSEDHKLVEQQAFRLDSHISKVSRSKQELAYRSVCGLTNELDSEIPLKEQACFILGGDIVYNMAHDVQRPERSTGRLVQGSDMDLVVVVDNLCPPEVVKRLDESIFREKIRLLTAPHIKEEIDYIVKNLNRVMEQIKFNTFKKMMACKILNEGAFLYGSEEIFSTIKKLLKQNRIPEKLKKLEQKAIELRRISEQYLLNVEMDKLKDEYLHHFYPIEESEEFE